MQVLRSRERDRATIRGRNHRSSFNDSFPLADDGEDAARPEKLLKVANEPQQIISAATGLRDFMEWDGDFERDKRDPQ